MSKETKTKAYTKPSAVKKTENDGFCVYIGPTITGVIQKGTVYKGSKEQALSQINLSEELYPLVSSLTVSGEKLAEGRIKVKTAGNILYENYRKIEKR